MKVVGGPRDKGQTAEKLKPIEADIARALKKGAPKGKAAKGKRPKLPAIDIHIRVDLDEQMR